MKENKEFSVSWNWVDDSNREYDDGTFNGGFIRFLIRGHLYEQFDLEFVDWPLPLQEYRDHD